MPNCCVVYESRCDDAWLCGLVGKQLYAPNCRPEFDSFWCMFFFLFLGGTRSLRMPALRPASQAGPMHNPRKGTSVVLRDTIQANLMVCVVCSCCATSLYKEVCRAKGGIGSGETLCHDIYPARPITTVSLAVNTYCIMDGLSSCTPWAPGSNLAVRVNRTINDRPAHTAGGHLLSVVQAATNIARL